MSRPTRFVHSDHVDDLLGGVGKPSPAEGVQSLTDCRYVVLAGDERKQGLRSVGRATCTVVDMTGGNRTK